MKHPGTSRVMMVVLALLFLAPVALPLAASHHRAPIQPGGLFFSEGYTCTFNLVFRDPAGVLFIGTAAHCVGNVSTRLAIPDVGEFGTLVYAGNLTDANGGVAGLDFALIRIDADKYDLVDPATRFWGGPTGIETEFLPGTPLVLHGQGAYVSSTEFTRSRTGTLHFAYGKTGSTSAPAEYEGWYLASAAIMSGDSGGFMLTNAGDAVGVTALPAFLTGEPGVVSGPTFAWILEEIRKDGWDLEVVTSAFNLDDPAGLSAEASDTINHCSRSSYGNGTSDACAKVATASWRTGPPGQWDDWDNATLLGRDTIVAGGPHAEYFTIRENPIGERTASAALPVDSFQLPSPAAGSLVGTKTTAAAGDGHNVDLHFWTDSGWILGTPGCATVAPDEVCQVPDEAETMIVAAMEGAALDVSVFLLRDPAIDGPNQETGHASDASPVPRMPSPSLPMFLIVGTVLLGAARAWSSTRQKNGGSS